MEKKVNKESEETRMIEIDVEDFYSRFNSLLYKKLCDLKTDSKNMEEVYVEEDYVKEKDYVDTLLKDLFGEDDR